MNTWPAAGGRAGCVTPVNVFTDTPSNDAVTQITTGTRYTAPLLYCIAYLDLNWIEHNIGTCWSNGPPPLLRFSVIAQLKARKRNISFAICTFSLFPPTPKFN